MRDHNPIPLTQFNGLWQRGRFDAVPQDHATDLLNVKFTQNGVDTRDGFAQTFAVPSAKRAYVYKIFGEADRILFIDNGSPASIWDSTNLSVPILTVAGMTDFAFVNLNGRAYISPHNGVTGLPSQSLYIYNGTGAAWAAAGAAPTGNTFTATEVSTAGNVAAGFHIFAVTYLTDTGFFTSLGPDTFATCTSTGNKSVQLTNIPTSPNSHVIA